MTAATSTTLTAIVVVPLKHLRPSAQGTWYLGPTTTSVTFFSEFENEVIYGFADGVDIGPLTVGPGGAVTLDTAAGWVHLGRRREAVWESLKLYRGAQQSTGIGGVTKRVNELGLVLKDTGDCLKIGSRGEGKTKGLALKPVQAETGTVGAVFTGECRQRIPGEHELDPRIIIIAEKAGPAQISATSPMYRINER